MDFNKNGIAISVADDVIEELILERLRGYDKPPQVINKVVMIESGVLPRIGAEVTELGGVFAGVVRGAAGESDYYLIVGPESPSKLEWQPAIDWAEGVKHLGFADFELFNRREQSICYANVPELFQKEWYWSSEQHASDSYVAWAQGFDYGSQYYYDKDNDYRAHAVRRVPIR